jgi:hypothetical protein
MISHGPKHDTYRAAIAAYAEGDDKALAAHIETYDHLTHTSGLSRRQLASAKQNLVYMRGLLRELRKGK